MASLIAERAEIRHELLDRLPQNTITSYIREILMTTTGILPPRHEQFAQPQLWLDATVKGLPPHERAIIHPFAEWEVLRDALRRVAR